MNIPEEAIEAAARAMHPEVWDKALFVREYGEMAGRVHMRRAQKEWLGIARAALEAAAPLLMAQALRDSADDFKGEDLALDVILAGPDAVRHHLNSRADVMTRVEL